MGDITFNKQISKAGKLTYLGIPPQALQALGWSPGDKMELIVRNGEILVRPQEYQKELVLKAGKRKRS